MSHSIKVITEHIKHKNMPTNSFFYNPLGSLVKVSNLPDSLSFMKSEKLQEIIDKLYYKHLQFIKSNDGSQAYFDLKLIIPKGLNLDVFDTGLSLVLFPNPDDPDSSEIELSLNYSWQILGLIKGFSSEGFDYAIETLKNIFFSTIHISDYDIITRCALLFEGGNTASALSNFAAKLNSQYQLTGSNEISVSPTGDFESLVEELILSIYNKLPDYGIEEITTNIYLNNTDNFKSYCLSTLNKSIDTYIKEFITPKIEASIQNISLGLAFPRNILRPIKDENGNPAAETDRSMLIFSVGDLSFSTENGITLERPEGSFELNYASEIGNTGIGIDFKNVKLDLSRNSNILEADLDGRPDDFMGVYAEEVGISLPEKWFKNPKDESEPSLKLVGKNILAGTGGFSGVIGLENENGVLWKRFGDSDFAIGFEKFHLKFQQNLITESQIKGKLKIPRFKKSGTTTDEPLEIDVEGCFSESGDFNLTANTKSGIKGTLFNLITFNFVSMSFGREGSNFFISASCEISFPKENQLMSSMFKDQKLTVPSLRIYDSGKIEIEGGAISLPTSLNLSILKKKDDGEIDKDSKPLFSLNVTDIIYGTSERDGYDYNYIGFDGAISLGPLGVDARGKGIKYYFREGHSFLRLQTIELDLVIPGTASASDAAVIIKGSVTMPDPEAEKNEEREEYRGSIELSIPKINLSAGAKMRLNKKYPAFAVDAYLNLPTPIPIGPVGIYGFRGIVGYRYLAQKGEQEKTWYDYFKRPPKGISIDKFVKPEKTANAKDPFTIGAGAVIGTSFDSGKIISARVMLLLSMPEMFTIEGKAGILSTRMSLDENEEPPFYAFLTWATDAIEFGVGVDLSIPKEREFKIITLKADIEARFPKKSPGAWYFYAGTREKPITASVLESIFDLRAQSFLMLSSQGMEAGARVDFEFKKSLFGIKVRIYAYVGLEGKISFERPQIGGSLYFGGGIEVNVWRVFYVSVNLDTALSMEVAKPFKLYALLHVHGKLKVIGLKVPYNTKVRLEWEKEKHVDLAPVCPLILSTNTTAENLEDPIKAVHMLTNETYTLNRLAEDDYGIHNIVKTIPVDSYIDIKFDKGVKVTDNVKNIIAYPGTSTADSYTEKLPPVAQSGSKALRQVTHAYSIEDFKLKAYIDGEWIDYSPYVAAHPNFSSLSETEKQKIRNIKAGSIQLTGEKDESIRLLTNNPFSYIEHGRDLKFEPEIFGLTAKTIFCPKDKEVHKKINVLNKDSGTIYYFNDDNFKTKNINGANFKIKTFNNNPNINKKSTYSTLNALKVDSISNDFNFSKSLIFSNYNSIQIDLMEKSADVKLKLTTKSKNVKVSYYGLEVFKYGTLYTVNSQNEIAAPLTYKLLNEIIYTKEQLENIIQYKNSEVPIRRIIITPYASDINEILNIKDEIEKLLNESYDTTTIIVNDKLYPTDANVTKLGELIGQLRTLLEDAGIEWDCKDNEACKLFVRLAKYYPKDYNAYASLTNAVKDSSEQFKHLIHNYTTQALCASYCENYRVSFSNFDYWMNKGFPDEAFSYYKQMNKAAYEIMKIHYNHCCCADILDDKFSETWTALHELEYLTIEQEMTNETIPGHAEKAAWIQSAVDSINETIQPVWRPDTYFRIEFELRDNVSYENATNSTSYRYCYGFKTAKPIGYLEVEKELNEDRVKKLNDLASYIDFNRSYPNADGNLLNAKPVFYGHRHCNIDVFFTKTYTSRLLSPFPKYTVGNKTFPRKDYAINIKIKDPVSECVIPYPLPVTEEYKHLPKALPLVKDIKDSFWSPLQGDEHSFWKVDTQPMLNTGIELIQNLLDESNNYCDSYGGDTIIPKSTLYTLQLTNLKPQKLYTAIICNYDGSNNKQVHEYVFKTSRYYSFKEQVESYRIKDEEKIPLEYTEESILLGQDPEKEIEDTVACIDAIYPLPILEGQNNTDASSKLQMAYLITSNYPNNPTTDSIESKYYNDYPNPFDRVIEGIFEIRPMEAAIGTEFNILTYNNKTVGILIRNPEPFNNPRMPVNEVVGIPADNVKGTIIVINGKNQDNDYKVLHSKDYSQAIIMYKDIYFSDSTDVLNLEFRYKLWNGSERKYEIKETVLVELKLKQGIEFWEIGKDFIVKDL